MSAAGNGPSALLDGRSSVIRILVLNRMHLDEWPAEPVEAIPDRLPDRAMRTLGIPTPE
jgi:hypothetical protein